MIVLLAALAFQCPAGTPPPCRTASAAARTPDANSVAVLYFDNASRDTGDSYLADGLTEEIILRLQQVPRLQVRSRFESQRVRGRRNAAPGALGRELSARYLVSGTITRSGERLVVRVELTQADRGVGVWSQRFDRASGDVLDIIDEIARGVATGVAGQLLPAEAAQIARRPTENAAAYEHYVRGNVYLARRTPVMFQRAIGEYAAARAADPAMTAATARIAYAWSLAIAYGYGDLQPDSIDALASMAIARAMREAPAVPETWLAQGFQQLIRTLLRRQDNMAAAVSSLARGAELGPDNAEAHHQYGQGLVMIMADSAALAEYRKALRLEPGRAVSYEEIARQLIIMGRNAEALANADSAVAADPQLVRGLLTRARVLLTLGDIAGAERDIGAASGLAPQGRSGNELLSLRAMALVARGDTAQAREVVAPMFGVPLASIFGDDMLAAIGLGDRALDAIESQSIGAARCYRLRFPFLRALRGTPHYDRVAAGCTFPDGR